MNGVVKNLKHSMASVTDLTAYLSASFGNFVLMNHNWWVPRKESDGTVFPDPKNGTGKARSPDGWPSKTSDKNANANPIISDLTDCAVTTTDPDKIPENNPPINGAYLTGNAHFLERQARFGQHRLRRWSCRDRSKAEDAMAVADRPLDRVLLSLASYLPSVTI